VTLFDAGEPAITPEPASSPSASPVATDPAPVAGSSARTHLALTVAYDGTEFRGFAEQPRQRTVAGVLREALAQALHGDLADLAGAGRTDAGVHAWGQVVSCSTGAAVDPQRLAAGLTRRLGPEVVVREARVVDPGFHARHSATDRTYRYTVVNRPVPDPFLARFSWWVPEPLEIARLRLGADPFVGEHDFAAFCRKGPEGSTTVRRVLRSHWDVLDDGVLRYEIRATAFCWQMVRSVVGTLVDIGRGRRTAGDVLTILRARDRARAGRLAPRAGLGLWRFDYSPRLRFRGGPRPPLRVILRRSGRAEAGPWRVVPPSSSPASCSRSRRAWGRWARWGR
jgi:tRNA pseudouridine38-40 synthase